MKTGFLNHVPEAFLAPRRIQWTILASCILRTSICDRKRAPTPVNVWSAIRMAKVVHTFMASMATLQLFWGRSTDSSVVSSYEVYRDGQLYGSVDEHSFFEGDSMPGTSYPTAFAQHWHDCWFFVDSSFANNLFSCYSYALVAALTRTDSTTA